MEGTMRFALFTTKAVCTLLIALGIALARPAWAAEIRVLNANALTVALRELAAEHTKQTGNQVTFISGSPGQIQQKVDAGEQFDLLIMPTPALTALDTAAKLAAGTKRALVRVGIGIAIREGAPKPDISTPDALRKTLLAQQKITYSDSRTGGLSGINAQKVLDNLGIADEIKSKVLPHADGHRLPSCEAGGALTMYYIRFRGQRKDGNQGIGLRKGCIKTRQGASERVKPAAQ
jgi:molybdate transport system substrate-binding protein